MKPIKGYPDYSITRDGRVWSHPRPSANGRWRKPSLSKFGYLSIILCKNGRIKSHLVHRLVAQAFISNPKNKPCINHKDGNKLNSHVSNLEWVTNQENSIHAYKNGLTIPYVGIGEENGNAKLTWKQVREIRNNHISKGVMKRKPWEKYEIQKQQYYSILRGERWKEVD